MGLPIISIVIPHNPNLEGVQQKLEECLRSIPSNIDIEVLVNAKDQSFSTNCNEGLARARASWLMIMNNDMKFIHGANKIMRLTRESFCVPQIVPEPKDYCPRGIYCMPRKVYEAIRDDEYADDFYDEQFYPGYFEDDDLIERAKLLGLKFYKAEDIIVSHENGGGFSMHQVSRDEAYERNEKLFKDKWS